MIGTDSIPGFNNIVNNDLSIKINLVQPPVIVLELKGYIDTYNTPFVEKKINLAIANGFDRIICDLSGITYMSSTGIGVFTAILRQLKGIRGELILSGVPEKIMDVFRLIGFSSFFRFEPSAEEAVAQVREKKAPEKPPYPKMIRCSCQKKLRISRAGQFRCPRCRTVISADERGAVRKVL